MAYIRAHMLMAVVLAAIALGAAAQSTPPPTNATLAPTNATNTTAPAKVVTPVPSADPAIGILRQEICYKYSVLKTQLSQAADTQYPTLFANDSTIYDLCGSQLAASVDLMSSSLALVGASCGATASPSLAPTAVPTSAVPSLAPTLAPDAKTDAPTTAVPTHTPTLAPDAKTDAPTTAVPTTAAPTTATAAPSTATPSTATAVPTTAVPTTAVLPPKARRRAAVTAAPTNVPKDFVWNAAVTAAPAAQCAKAFAAVDAFLEGYRKLRDAVSTAAGKKALLSPSAETWTLTFSVDLNTFDLGANAIITGQSDATWRSLANLILRDGARNVSASALITVNSVAYADKACARTLTPTLAPVTTVAPTTAKPTTLAPAPTVTFAPTLSPTNLSTNAPTPTPSLSTVAPTPLPTIAPTNATGPTAVPSMAKIPCSEVVITTTVYSDDWTAKAATVDAANSKLLKGASFDGMALSKDSTHTGTLPTPAPTPAEASNQTTMIIIIVVVVVVVVIVIAAVVVSKRRSGHSTSRDGTSGIDL